MRLGPEYICRTQPYGKKLPVIPGHEVGAIIEEVGPGVPAELKKGMNVTLNPYTNCGKCASCRSGRVNACEHNETLGVQRNGVMCGIRSIALEQNYPGR